MAIPTFILLKSAVYIQFCVLSYTVLQRFAAINEGFDLLRAQIHKIEWMVAAERKMVILCELHLKLQKVLNEMESYFAVQLSALMSINIFFTSVELFRLLEAKPTTWEHVFLDVMILTRFLTNIIWTCFCANLCSLVQNEVGQWITANIKQLIFMLFYLRVILCNRRVE